MLREGQIFPTATLFRILQKSLPQLQHRHRMPLVRTRKRTRRLRLRITAYRTSILSDERLKKLSRLVGLKLLIMCFSGLADGNVPFRGSYPELTHQASKSRSESSRAADFVIPSVGSQASRPSCLSLSPPMALNQPGILDSM